MGPSSPPASSPLPPPLPPLPAPGAGLTAWELGGRRSGSWIPGVGWGAADMFPAYLLAMGLGYVSLIVSRVWFMAPLKVAGNIAGLEQELFIGAAVLFWIRFVRPSPLAAFGTVSRAWSGVGLGIAVGFGNFFTAGIVIEITIAVVRIFIHRAPSFPRVAKVTSWWELVVVGLALVIAAPLGEELYFRGFVYGGLRKRFPQKVALPISAVAFALWHIEVLRMPYTFVSGLIFGAVYERRRNLLPSMIAHATNNLLGFIALVHAFRR